MPENPNRAEVARRVEKAEKLLQKGKTADALAEYLQILEGDPQNDNVRQMAAELCLSLNRGDQAVRLLGELFERQVAATDATRASLTYKKLARYANPTWEQKVRFGQLLEHSNKKLAIGTYENALEDLQRQGKKEETLLVLQRIVSLEPSQPNHLRVAELSAELGEHVMASQSFLQLAELAETSGGNAASWFERAYTENPTDPKIAVAYGKSLLSRGEAGAAIFIFEPLIHSGDASLELRELYAQALLSADRCLESEPLIWQIFEQNPARMHQVVNLIGKMIDSELDAEAVALARKLEAFQRRRGERRSFITTMQELLASHRPSAEMLEFLAELFNASNRETDYAQALLKLFELYCTKHDYQKAGECLDRAAEVDPYEPGHQKRLEALRGKIDDQRFNVIASRFTTVKKEEQEVKVQEPTLGAAALQDLMLQAEILVQYGMRSKAIERLQRIQELFPREEERNQDLQKLYIAAGIAPQYAKSATPAASSVPAAANGGQAAPGAAATAASEAADVSSLARVAEITRKLGALHRGPAQTGSAAVERAGTSHGRADSGQFGGPGEPGGNAAGSGGGARHGDDGRCQKCSGVDGRAQRDRRVADRIAAGSAVDRRHRPDRSADPDPEHKPGLAAFGSAGDPDVERPGVDRAQQCRAATVGEESFGDGREIGAAEAGFVSGSSAGGNPAWVAAGDGCDGVAHAVWTAQRADQRTWRAGGNGGDGADRAAVFSEHPDERSGVPLRSDDSRAGARRHGRKRSAAGSREIAAAAERSAFPG